MLLILVTNPQKKMSPVKRSKLEELDDDFFSCSEKEDTLLKVPDSSSTSCCTEFTIRDIMLMEEHKTKNK